MRRFALRHPFLLLGIATMCFFFITPSPSSALLPVARVLIMAVWFGWTVTMILTAPLRELPFGGPVLEALLRPVFTVVGGLLLYLLADGVLALYRRGVRTAWKDFRTPRRPAARAPAPPTRV